MTLRGHFLSQKALIGLLCSLEVIMAPSIASYDVYVLMRSLTHQRILAEVYGDHHYASVD